MEAFIIGILIGLIVILLVSFFKDDNKYFNANRFKAGSESEIVPIHFHVIKIEESDTQYDESCISKKLWKYTVETHFFFKKDKKFIYDEYVFWDEPERYKVGDVLTLSNIKEPYKK